MNVVVLFKFVGRDVDKFVDVFCYSVGFGFEKIFGICLLVGWELW